MAGPVSIMDSPLWIGGGSGHPYIVDAFIKGFNLFLQLDRFGGPFLVNNHLTLDKWYFAFDVQSKLSVASPVARTAPQASAAPEDDKAAEESIPFAYMCAVPFTVTRAMCNDTRDGDSADVAEPKEGDLQMSTAAVSLMTDMITSFHAFLALHPKDNGHVSVNIQTNQTQPLLLGKSYVAVAKIDKMGRRIIFASVDYVEQHLAPDQARKVTEAGLLAEGTTIAQLKAVLPYCTVLANSKHVKSILSADAQKRAAASAPQAPKAASSAITAEVEPTPEC